MGTHLKKKSAWELEGRKYWSFFASSGFEFDLVRVSPAYLFAGCLCFCEIPVQVNRTGLSAQAPSVRLSGSE
jgi:hypothetical protein